MLYQAHLRLTCSARHLPGFIEHADKLKAAGVDKIACLAVNDAHAMKAWGDASGATGKIDMIADSTALFAEALGIAVNMGPNMAIVLADAQLLLIMA